MIKSWIERNRRASRFVEFKYAADASVKQARKNAVLCQSKKLMDYIRTVDSEIPPVPTAPKGMSRYDCEHRINLMKIHTLDVCIRNNTVKAMNMIKEDCAEILRLMLSCDIFIPVVDDSIFVKDFDMILPINDRIRSLIGSITSDPIRVPISSYMEYFTGGFLADNAPVNSFYEDYVDLVKNSESLESAVLKIPHSETNLVAALVSRCFGRLFLYKFSIDGTIYDTERAINLLALSDPIQLLILFDSDKESINCLKKMTSEWRVFIESILDSTYDRFLPNGFMGRARVEAELTDSG